MSVLPARARSLWHPIYGRRFRRALLVLLGDAAFARLPAATRARVEARCDDINTASGGVFPWGVVQRRGPAQVPAPLPADLLATWHAVAMAELALPTGVDGLSWDHVLGARAPRHPALLHGGFRRFHPATDDAIALLREHGVAVDARSAQAHDWLAAMRHRFP